MAKPSSKLTARMFRNLVLMLQRNWMGWGAFVIPVPPHTNAAAACRSAQKKIVGPLVPAQSRTWVCPIQRQSPPRHIPLSPQPSPDGLLGHRLRSLHKSWDAHCLWLWLWPWLWLWVAGVAESPSSAPLTNPLQPSLQSLQLCRLGQLELSRQPAQPSSRRGSLGAFAVADLVHSLDSLKDDLATPRPEDLQLFQVWGRAQGTRGTQRTRGIRPPIRTARTRHPMHPLRSGPLVFGCFPHFAISAAPAGFGILLSAPPAPRSSW